MKACDEMQTVHASTFQMTNQLIMLHQQEKNNKTDKQAHKNKTKECHGQDQQTLTDELLFKKIN